MVRVVVIKTNLELAKRIEKATKEKKTLSHILSQKMRVKDLIELPLLKTNETNKLKKKIRDFSSSCHQLVI
jgi:hypothetical protein